MSLIILLAIAPPTAIPAWAFIALGLLACVGLVAMRRRK